jgi:hypothetical protein
MLFRRNFIFGQGLFDSNAARAASSAGPNANGTDVSEMFRTEMKERAVAKLFSRCAMPGFPEPSSGQTSRTPQMVITFRELLQECEAMMESYVELDRDEILASDDEEGAIVDMAMTVREGIHFDLIDNASLVAMLTEKPELVDYESRGVQGTTIRSAIIDGIGTYVCRHLIEGWYEESPEADAAPTDSAAFKGFGM